MSLLVKHQSLWQFTKTYLRAPAEGAGGLEASYFEVTFYIPIIVTVLRAVNQIPGIQTMQRIYQVATRPKTAKSKRSKDRCGQRTTAVP